MKQAPACNLSVSQKNFKSRIKMFLHITTRNKMFLCITTRAVSNSRQKVYKKLANLHSCRTQAVRSLQNIPAEDEKMLELF